MLRIPLGAVAALLGWFCEPPARPQFNLTYAVPCLANAYLLADGNEDRATALFSSAKHSPAA